MKISPSILACSLIRLADTISKLDPEITDLIHLDIMDGHFVPQLTFGEQIAKEIVSSTRIPIDVHLMVSHPEREVPKYFALKPHNITFHYEATLFPLRLARTIREQNILAGIALNPSTPVSFLKDVISAFDMVLLMTVEPGYYGQKFLDTNFDRIKELVDLKEKYNNKLLIEVDGGIDNTNSLDLKKSGVNILVSGSFIFKAKDPNHQIAILK